MSIPQFRYDAGAGEVTVDLSTPLAKDDPYVRRSHRSDSFSQSGVMQSAHEYIEEIKEIELTFLTTAERDNMITMFETWTSKGEILKFIPDEDSPGTFNTVTILDKDLAFEREAAGLAFWRIGFNIRKEVS